MQLTFHISHAIIDLYPTPTGAVFPISFYKKEKR